VAEVGDTAPGRAQTLVTGANGFVGRALCKALASAGRPARAALREQRAGFADAVVTGDIGPETDWRAALEGIRCVVHLAARTHVLSDTAADPLAEYRRINFAGTDRLARAAVAQGVRRFVFLSSVKVNGERTVTRPFTEDDAPRPEDAYGASKWEAEQALARVAVESRLEVVVLRSPLVYGPGVRGNFLRLMHLVARGVPLPLGAAHNRRSLVYVGNLADAIVKAIDAPRAAGRTYLVADGEDVSTPELVRALARALGVTPRLPSLPLAVLDLAAAIVGRRAELARLTDSLQVDCSRIRSELDWRPRHGLAQGLQETARWYYSKSGA